MNCSSCNAVLVENAKFCGECGAPVQWSCAACGTPNPPHHKFCSECGQRRETPGTTSEPPAASVVTAPATPPPLQPVPDPEPLVPISATAEGERRHLTVMFCDLVGSTELSGTMDPEELKSLVLAYQTAAGGVIEAAGGWIGHYMGDGILAYFGYPVADEQASVKAVRAGLQLIEAVRELRHLHAAIDCRVGIHSGMTVVADMGAGEQRQFADVVGETPNIAARMEGVATPGHVAVSQTVRDECEGFLDFESLGPHQLKGVVDAMEVYQPVADSGVRDRLELAARQSRLTPLFGRDAELRVLTDAWRRTQLGDPQVVWISGEPGIGKSRLVRQLIAQVRSDEGIEIDMRCSENHQTSSLYPAAEQFRRFMNGLGSGFTIEGCEQLCDDTGTPRSIGVPVVAQLLNIPITEPYRPLEGSNDHIRAQMLEGVARLIEDRSDTQPVLVVFDDFQWIDSTTEELAERFIGADRRSAVMTVVTFRSSYAIDVPAASHHHHLEIERIDAAGVRSIIEHVIGDDEPIPQGVVEEIARRAEGIPLFAEELAHLMLQSPQSDGLVPGTLRDSLMARIDRLGPEADVVRILSIFGREAPDSLLHLVTGYERGHFLEQIESLLDAGLIVQRGSGANTVYAFRHALQQDVAYESMLKSTRRTLHGRVAEALELRFVARVAAEPEVSARHLELAGEPERALPYLLKAGDRAIAISAHAEALSHLHHALELVEEMPAGEDRDGFEMDVLIRLGVPTTATLGYGSAEAEGVYARAEALADRVESHPNAYHALYGLFRTRLLQAEYAKADDLAGRLVALASGAPDQTYQQVGVARAYGSLGFYVGHDQPAALDHLNRAITFPDADRTGAYLGDLNDVVDPIITCRAYAAWSNWLVGNAKEARQHSDEAVRAARRLAHPFTLCLALSFDSWLCQFEGDVQATIARASEALEAAEEHGFPFWHGWAKVLLEWGEAQLGAPDRAESMRLGVAEWQAQGSALGKSYFIGLIAQVELQNGATEAAARSVDEAIQIADSLGEYFWKPELLRLKAEILAAMGESDDAASLLADARSLAMSQGAAALVERIDAAT